jgi:murein endopeptidase
VRTSRAALSSAAAIVAVISIAAAVAQRGALVRAMQPAAPVPVSSALVMAPLWAARSPAAPIESPPPSEPAPCAPEPPLEIRAVELPPEAELVRIIREQPVVLGSASIGSPTRGSLFGGVEMKESEGILRAGGYGWGTEMVIRSIERAVRAVCRCFPGSPRLYVGDIARERGGWLKPHRSHQSGLDADIGYYYVTQATWYQRATAENLDAARTWALVRALIEGGNVEMIFIDVSLRRLLKAHIAKLPEGERPPEDLFERPEKKDTIIRHAWGHTTHFHVRFRDPAAVALGERLANIPPHVRAALLAHHRSAVSAVKPFVGAPRPK